jgi:hypothetical protein
MLGVINSGEKTDHSVSCDTEEHLILVFVDM